MPVIVAACAAALLLAAAAVVWIGAEMADATARWEASRDADWETAVDQALSVASPIPDTIPADWSDR